MISTILKNPPPGYENLFAGNFEEVPADRVEVPVMYEGNLHKPILVHGNWVESATETEISIGTSSVCMIRLQNYAADLRIRAKAAAIGKKGDRDYVFAQVEMYELKYRIATGEISDQYMLSLMESEALEFGNSIGVEMTLTQFQELIIYMYETAEDQYNLFLFMIERCRTFIQTLIENTEWVKVDQAFALIDTLNDAAQATDLMANILNL